MARRRGYGDHWYPYYPKTTPKTVRDGIKAKSKRGAIGETWWSKRWVSVLESFNMGARLTRGRAYARRGQVISIVIEEGLVTAQVQGSRSQPYGVEIRLEPLSDQEWEKITEAMASRAIFAAKLLSGEMPQNIEEAFGEVEVSLFPISGDELETDCSCPDWANPCKHIAAVYYLLAERFDDDPFLIFQLRGRTEQQTIEALREKRAATLPTEGAGPSGLAEAPSEDAAVPLEECLEGFWKTGEALDSFQVHLEPPEVETAILKRLGEAPFKVRGHKLDPWLTRAYAALSEAALQKAVGEPQEREQQPRIRPRKPAG